MERDKATALKLSLMLIERIQVYKQMRECTNFSEISRETHVVFVIAYHGRWKYKQRTILDTKTKLISITFSYYFDISLR